MRPGLQPVMRAAVERLRREGKRFDLFDLCDISDLLDALDDCPYCDRMLKAERALRDIRDLATTAGYSAKQLAAIARAALSSEDATRPTGDKE